MNDFINWLKLFLKYLKLFKEGGWFEVAADFTLDPGNNEAINYEQNPE